LNGDGIPDAHANHATVNRLGLPSDTKRDRYNPDEEARDGQQNVRFS
jgi:hypothetical protein